MPATSALPILAQWRGTLRLPSDAAAFVPPPRFAKQRFSTFIIDPSVAGQAAAVARVEAFAARTRRRPWQWRRRHEKAGLYLDGDFGVGKTHLLASAWHAASGRKRYLSFSEAINLTVLQGPAKTVEMLAGELVCIDEFELDDPSNTRLADLLIAGLVARETRLLVTSNTVPGELGKGRMFVDQFRAQLNRVAAIFDDVHVPGHDFRSRWRGEHGGDPQWWGREVSPAANMPVISAAELDQALRQIPVVSLRQIAGELPGLLIDDLAPCADQLIALRLVHFVDRLYDWQVPLRVRATCHLDELFKAEYRELGFAKKYRRCLSRLAELCRPAAA